MPAAVVDRIPRRRKIRVGEAAHRDRDMRLLVALLGVEQVRAADRAEAEREPGALVANANIFGCARRRPCRGPQSRPASQRRCRSGADRRSSGKRRCRAARPKPRCATGRSNKRLFGTALSTSCKSFANHPGSPRAAHLQERQGLHRAASNAIAVRQPVEKGGLAWYRISTFITIVSAALSMPCKIVCRADLRRLPKNSLPVCPMVA